MRDVEDLFGVPVIEAYGMTEAAHQIASNPLPPGRRLAGSVGLPAGVEIAIVDETGVPVPAGGQGEIVIQGPGVLARYEADAATNAASFVNGYLRTGDLGRFDPDGYLFLTGRIKELINRGGEKIAPAEVDAVLLEHAAVRQAVAFGVPHPTLGEDVAAAIVPRAGALVTETELREFVATRLSAFKVPRRVHVVDEIPKGPTGKLNRRMLAEHFAGEAASRAVEPRTPTEELLVRIWAEILNVQTVGIRDNYCALGGDSLRATAIAARAQEAGLPMEPQMLFEHPTIEELAGILARA
jgi:acyl-CoA synthetase (AMP-forming)/AMP-acid ligase II